MKQEQSMTNLDAFMSLSKNGRKLENRHLSHEELNNIMHLPAEKLIKLSFSNNIEIRAAVAASNNTPLEILEKLATDKPSVRACVANNKNSSKEILTKLAYDEEAFIRLIVINNENTPISVLEKLAENDNDIENLCSIARNNITLEVVQKLIKHHNAHVYDAILKNFKIEKQITSEILFEIVKNCDDTEVLERIAVHPNTSLDILEELLKSYNFEVYSTMACIDNVTSDLLTKLARNSDYNTEVCNFIAQNSNASSELLMELYKNCNNDNDVCMSLALNNNASSELLDKLANHKDSSVCYFVVLNYNTSMETIKKLQNHDSELVKKTVQKVIQKRFSWLSHN